jgi:NADPH:quinone reductase-like Zn-dependent oxidoreductase
VEADPEGKVCIFLSEIDELILSRPTENQFLQLQKALISSVASIWVAHGGYQYPDRPHANLCAGLLRTIRTEHEANAALIELNPISDLGFDEQSALVVSVTRRLLATETPKDFEYAEDAGQLMVPRIVEAKEINTNIGHLSNHDAILAHYSYQPSRNLPLRIGTPSESDTLHFNDVSPPPPKSGQIEIQVAASGITSSGNTAFAQNSSPYPYIGNQVSGIVSRVGSSVTRFSVGDKVCAISHHELCTSVTCDSAIAVEVPDWMNMEEAASIPATYFAAHYVTIEAAAVTECDSVIIEWSGEFALAAIQLAKVTSADVYVAVRNDEDRTQVSAMGCGITDTHIFDSRSPHFSREVEDATGGKGASVVITFARPEQNNVGSCIADFGRLVQVRTSAQLGDRGEIRLAGLKSNYTVTVVDLDSLVRLRPKTIERVLLRVMKLFRDRKLTLKPPAVFSTRHTKRAIDEVANGRNKGPVVVANCPDDQVQVKCPLSVALKHQKLRTFLGHLS